LLFFVLHRMTKAPWESAFVAALFALHPLRVESVAWVAERKDVLSTFFWMLTMGAYCSYVEQQRFLRYLIVVTFFALGLMTKPMLVTLPFVLLLLDYWPLQRFQQMKSDRLSRKTACKPLAGENQKGTSKKMPTAGLEVKAELTVESQRHREALIRSLLVEKIPLFALTALSSIVTYLVQQGGGAVASLEAIPLSARISNAIVSYIAYIGKTIWPSRLAVLYPHPQSLPTWQVLGAALFLIVITSTVIWNAKRIPYLVVGWLWYVGSLVPVIGIVQVGLQARADRFTYIPLIGLFIMASWGISELSRNWRYRKEVLLSSSTIILVCLCIVTWRQVGYWQNSIMLFDHTIQVTNNNDTAYNYRGAAYLNLGDYKQAIDDFNKSIEIYPMNIETYYNRGTAYLQLGSFKHAIGDYDKVIEINPKHEKAYNNRGTAYASLGNFKQAIQDYSKVLEINPNSGEAYNNRGTAYAKIGNYKQAIGDYNKAIEINPKHETAYNNRGNAYLLLGDNSQAIENYKAAARLGHVNAQNWLKSRGIEW
jgi:protein O-mannosyl-transferase